MRWVRRALALALFAGVLVAGWRFAAENGQPVRVYYLVGAAEGVPLWRVLLGSFCTGAAVVALGWTYSSLHNALIRRRYRKELGGLEAEIHQLRNLPLAPDAPASGESAVAEPPPGGAVGRSA
jgi:uncharacterized integral membrane protein